jgi:uncharacterized protein YkwD
MAVLLVLGPTPAGGAGGAGQSCPDADLRPTGSNLPRVEKALVCLLNVERRRESRAPVSRDRRLDRSALRHTRDMTERGYFAHQRKGGPTLLARIRLTGYFEGARSAVYSENLGYAPPERATAESMTRAFSLSESHRKTMLYGRFRDIGIGSVLIDPHPAFYADYPAVVFTFDFGRRYERRRRCRRVAAAQGEDSRGRTTPPRRWCRRRASS